MKARISVAAACLAVLGAILVGCGGGCGPPIIALSTDTLTFDVAEGEPLPTLDYVTVTNVGEGTLRWTVAADKPWLQVSPFSDTATAEEDTITLSVIVSQAEAWLGPTSTSGAPSPRGGPSFVWTGAELIVWGGSDGVNCLVTGGCYDPATDTWTGVTSTDSASPRSGHRTVWTGEEMIVWGGHHVPGEHTNTGACYDPVTDRWTGQTSTDGAPSVRSGHSAVWTGTEMIVWGGSSGAGVLGTGSRYDPLTDTWLGPTSSDGAPTARRAHTAVWTGTEMLVWGGGPPAGNSNTGGRYDPQADAWLGATSTVSAPSARHLHGAAWTGAEMIVWGGVNGGLLNTGGRYDPVTDAWLGATTSSGAPSARSAPGAVWTGTEMIIWGGCIDFSGTQTDTGKLYRPPINLTAGTYTATITVSDPRAANSPQTIQVTLTVTSP